MSTNDDLPTLTILGRRPPENLADHPPLASSLQAFETALWLISIGRFPAALMSCGQAIESAAKAGLGIDKDGRADWRVLTERVREQIGAFPELDPKLKDFRDTRNDFMHFGFSPHDDSRSARQMLEVGFPYLEFCYRGFFSFELEEAMIPEIGWHYRLAKSTFSEDSDGLTAREHMLFCVLGHQIRWSFQPTFLSEAEMSILEAARESMNILDHADKIRSRVEALLDPCWFLFCPICGTPASLGVQLNSGLLDDRKLGVLQAYCMTCGLRIPVEVGVLADRLCRPEIQEQKDRIFEEFGVR
jgi:hypothetical protein